MAGAIGAGRYVHNIDRPGFTEALDAKHRAFGWMIQQERGPPIHPERRSSGSKKAWVPLWTGASNEPDLSPIELLCAVLKKLVCRATQKVSKNTASHREDILNNYHLKSFLSTCLCIEKNRNL
jgi:hypothetical protein